MVHRELKPIPIPDWASINTNDNRVFVYLDKGVVRRKSSTMVIGYRLEDDKTLMYPNDKFKYTFPDEWRKHYGDPGEIRREVSVGLYAATLGILHRYGMYDVLVDTFDTQIANGVIDFAMYMIAAGSSTAMNFQTRMRGSVLFSDKPRSDNWMSELFSKKLTKEKCIEFNIKWMKKCRDRGIVDVYLCIDGSNNDCDTDTDIAEEGHAKSGRTRKVVGFMYAFSAWNGMPVAFWVYEGGKVDSKAIITIIKMLESAGFRVKGIILDRGFCTRPVLTAIRNLEYQYVVMLKNNTYGHKYMLSKYSETIRLSPDHLVSLKGIFGICEKGQVFGNGGKAEEAYLNLFYDAGNGNERSLSLMAKVNKEKCRLEKKIKEMDGDEGKADDPIVPDTGLKKYLSVTTVGGKMEVTVNKDELFTSIKPKGFHTIASSEDLGVVAVDRLYDLREYSEGLYAMAKTQLDSATFRCHGKSAIIGKNMNIFVSLFLRWSLMDECRSLELATSMTIIELEMVHLFRMESGKLTSVKDLPISVKSLLKRYDILENDFDQIASTVNNREKEHNLYNAKPEHAPKPQKEKPGPKKKRNIATPPLKESKKGSKKGQAVQSSSTGTSPATNSAPGADADTASKNAAAVEQQKGQPKEKRGPGRPKGAKNKPKPGTFAARRKVGRPKGSKDKTPRKRRGSKNPTSETAS